MYSHAHEAVNLQRFLLTLSIPPHRVGYCHLCVAIPLFKENKRQCMTSELYPAVAEQVAYTDWRSVERAIRSTIKYAWLHRDPKIWGMYFPGCMSAPSNKHFIAVVAEYI